MKNYLLFIFIITLVFRSHGQDWFTKSDELYYWSDSGKVYLTPNYTSAAIYYEDDNFSSLDISEINSAIGLSDFKIADSVTVMNGKGIIQIRRLSDPLEVQIPDKRESFADRFRLSSKSPIAVLPSFSRQGNGILWLTKRVTLRLKEGVTISSMQKELNNFNAKVIKSLLKGRLLNVQLDSLERQFEFIHSLYTKGWIVWGEPDFKEELRRTNDPKYPEQWYLNNTGGTVPSAPNPESGNIQISPLSPDNDIDAPEAWEITKGSEEIIVAIIDDGLEDHEDLAAILPGYTPGVPFGPGSNGFQFLAEDAHGQSCAGIVAALHNDIGVRGIAPNVRLMSVNIFHPAVSNFDVADGIIWAVDNGADVLSNSWGFSENCNQNLIPAISEAFEYAAENGRNGAGCISIVSSGNDDLEIDCVTFPANLPTVMAVGAVDGTGAKSLYSNIGPTLDIVAPSNQFTLPVPINSSSFYTATYGIRTIDREGENGYSPSNSSSEPSYNDFFGGTSAACPQVAAVASLVLSVNPQLTKEQAENIILTSADDIGPAGIDNEFGYGRLNAFGAVSAALVQLSPTDISIFQESITFGMGFKNIPRIEYLEVQNNSPTPTIINLSDLNYFQPLVHEIFLEGYETKALPIKLTEEALELGGSISESMDIVGVDYLHSITLSAEIVTQPFSINFLNPNVMNITSDVPTGLKPIGYNVNSSEGGFLSQQLVGSSYWFFGKNELFSWIDISDIGSSIANGETIATEELLDNTIYMADRKVRRTAIFNGQLALTNTSSINTNNSVLTKAYFDNLSFSVDDVSVFVSPSQQIIYQVVTDESEFQFIFFNDGFMAFSFLKLPSEDISLIFEGKNSGIISSINISNLFGNDEPVTIYMSRSRINSFSDESFISFAGANNNYEIDVNTTKKANQLILFETNYQGINKQLVTLFDEEAYKNSQAPVFAGVGTNEMLFYPNPVETELKINWNKIQSNSIELEVRYFGSGELRDIYNLQKNIENLNVSSWEPGRYLLSIKNSSQKTVSIIKK